MGRSPATMIAADVSLSIRVVRSSQERRETTDSTSQSLLFLARFILDQSLLIVHHEKYLTGFASAFAPILSDSPQCMLRHLAFPLEKLVHRFVKCMKRPRSFVTMQLLVTL